MSEWSDRKRWWMDLLKTTIGSFLGIALTVLIVGYLEETRRRDAFIWQSNEALRVSATHEFGKAARLYRLRAYDAARERLRGLQVDQSEPIRKYHREAYLELTQALGSVVPLLHPADTQLRAGLEVELGRVFNAVNSAPLFPLGKTPRACDSKQEVDRAWTHQETPPPVREIFETQQMWVEFKRQCLDRVLTRYERAANAIVEHLRSEAPRLIDEQLPETGPWAWIQKTIRSLNGGSPSQPASAKEQVL